MQPFIPGTAAHCPHCAIHALMEAAPIRLSGANTDVGRVRGVTLGGANRDLTLWCARCPRCGNVIVTAEENVRSAPGSGTNGHLVYPLHHQRPPISPHVPADIAVDYHEAALVLPFSPKASAALVRRCLQAVLHDQGYTQRNLVVQIAAAAAVLPSHIATNIDYVRKAGNFAAHPSKDTAPGEIAPMTEGEAEWVLDVLELLFDFYYVKPALARQQRDVWDARTGKRTPRPDDPPTDTP